ncbi:MAG: hypothetical protein ABI674_07350 [Spartobacteria bacterium]
MMNTDRFLCTIGVLCLVPAAAPSAQQSTDELKQRLLAQAQNMSADDYAFTRTVRTEQTSNGKTERRVAVEKFDPTKPADARWTLVSVDGAPPATEELERFRKEAAKGRVVPGYHRLAGYLGSPATASTDPCGRPLFRFVGLPKGALTVMGSDVSENATAEVSVSEANGAPFVEQVHSTLKPMRLKLVVKIDRFESTARYRMGPEGKPLLVEQTTDMSGSGMGQEGRMHTTASYSDFRAVRGQR